ncbi:MAG: phenylalanine--tRNA ligase subunit beta [Bacteroidales bacterium]|nr:phenylalanine--tRNA ligase subunit beta [Bacteroidales bacterium]
MKISYNWLKDYVDTSLSPEEVAQILTNTGLEVEGREAFQSVEGGLEGLVIGRVTSCKSHPKADNLSITTVDVGMDRELPIVCGAPNVAEGQKVVVAKPGTKLFMNGKRTELKKTKIRGEVSEGMICAEDEVGLGDDHEGIIVLDDDAPLGGKVKDYFHFEEDTVLEIDLTPNRIDGASHIGVARDLVAYLRQKEDIKLKKPSVDHFKKDDDNLKIDVEIVNREACPRYSGVTLTNVNVEPSPEWLQNRLKAVGLNPINNLVDISNFVLLETGQPLHFFDADKIKDNKVLIQKLSEGTPFISLDKQEIKLSAEDLMICDTEKPMCIAGVLGGTNSGVTEHTKNLFIESAYFDPRHIRNTAKRHILNTDASYRFERGADPNNTVYALKRAALMVKEIAGGNISSEIVDEYPDPIDKAPVDLNFDNLVRLTGMEIPLPVLRTILPALDIEIEEETERGMKLRIPTYRVDVTREVDVIEEILRIYGYNRIETPEKLNATLTYSEGTDREQYTEVISTLLTGKGFTEIMSNSLTKSAYYNDLTTFPENNLVYLHNPLSSDLNSMRQTLLFGGLEAVAHNINHQRPDLKVFEIGNCYSRESTNESDDALKGFHEESHLGLFISGQFTGESWIQKQKPADFFHMKGYVENILDKLGFHMRQFKMEELETDIFDQGLRYKLKKHTVAEVGMVHQNILNKLDIEIPVYFGDIYWGKAMELAENNRVEYKEIPKYPHVRRDLALLLNEDIRFKQIEDLAYKTERKFLKDVSLFDVYQGEKLGENKKSYAVSFILQDEKQTLKEKHIDKIMKKLINTFREQLGAEIR